MLIPVFRRNWPSKRGMKQSSHPYYTANRSINWTDRPIGVEAQIFSALDDFRHFFKKRRIIDFLENYRFVLKVKNILYLGL